MMNQLTGMHYSPWTERARWALDHQGVPYRYSEYTTLLGEPALRLKARKLFGKVSVPLLVTPDGPVNDSFLIACHADANSAKAPLVPDARKADVRRWVDAAEQALCAARLRATRRISRSPGALAERLPGYTPDVLRRPLAPVAFVATQYILGKYAVPGADDSDLLQRMDRFFHQARLALGDRESLYEAFSFADIVIATSLQALVPVSDRYIPLGPASRSCMCEPALAAKYASLIDWRDRIYAHHRQADPG